MSVNNRPATICLTAAISVLTVLGLTAEEARTDVTSRVAAVAMHSEMGKPAANLDRIEQWCVKAHKAHARFAVFPEECITGSLNKSDIPLDEARRIVDQATKLAVPRLEAVARRLDMTLVVGTIEREGDKLRNCALVVGPRGHLTTFHKLWLPNSTEEKYFIAGTALPIVKSQGWTLSVGICADLNHADYFHTAAAHGAELFLLPVGGSGAANLVSDGGDQTKQAEYHKSLHERLMRKHAIDTGMYVFYANQAGHSGNGWFPGLSLAIDPSGRLVDEHLPTEGMTVTVVSKRAIAAKLKERSAVTAKECRNSSGKTVNVHVISESDPPGEALVPAKDIQIPTGFVVELVTDPSIVKYPMLGAFDDGGRLFVCESAGKNLDAAELLKQLPNSVKMLEDTDGDGRFDKSTMFADKMTLPCGAVWHDGALYVASPPSIWRLEDTDGDGVADRRDEVITGFNFRGHAGDVHGPIVGPDGRLYFTDGMMGHEIHDKDGKLLSKGSAARIFSSRLDGSDLETFCGGAMANPASVTMTEEGELFAVTTFFYYGEDRIRHDASFHCVHGGVYPRDRPFVRKELKTTGPVLPGLTIYGMSAPSNVMTYRGDALGAGYTGNLFISHFNTRTVTGASLKRAGATFRAEEKPFLSSTNPDFHPCGVIEDADGSLLVINTGGWFKIGCPTSSLQPQVLGGIYRVRRKDHEPPSDPRGLKIDWENETTGQLASRLHDKRFTVRDRAMTALAKRGEGAVQVLSPFAPRKKRAGDTFAERMPTIGAIWTLSRIGTPSACAAIRSTLDHADPSVRLVAATCVARHRDDKALKQLIRMIEQDEFAVQRQAAMALGRIGSSKAVPTLLNALAETDDPMLSHALVFALIEINDHDATLPGLQHPSPRVLRGALVALDQMTNGELTRELVGPLVNTDDAPLTHAVLDIVLRNSDWADMAADLLTQWLVEPELSQPRQKLLKKSLLTLHSQPSIQNVISQSLASSKISLSSRLMLLDVIAECAVRELPKAWDQQLHVGLRSRQEIVVQHALDAMAAKDAGQFDKELSSFAKDSSQLVALRVKAASILTQGRATLTDENFALLQGQCSDDAGFETRLEAARALGNAKLSSTQLGKVLELLPQAGPLELPVLLNAFADSWQRDSASRLGLRLVASLNTARSFPSVTEAQLNELFKEAPTDVRKAAERLTRRLVEEQAQSLRTVLKTTFSLVGGDPARGKKIFFSKMALCSACHQVNDQGNPIGPDLRSIGKVRNHRDLLEAILLPSSSFARGFESKTVTTQSGRIHAGIIRSETDDTITLYTSQRQEFKIKRAEIDEILPSKVSIMPAGLERSLTSDDLRDLLAYLTTLKGPAPTRDTITSP